MAPFSTFVVSAAFALAFGVHVVAAVEESTSPTPTTPHIVFVVADDMGFNDIGYHSNGSAIRTPNLDALANEGVKLENYYVAPLCTPTRSMLLSGRYLTKNGMQHLTISPWQPKCLPLTDPTLADKLSGAGYSTHMVGKWHLGLHQKECWPTNRGFQSFFGILLGAGDHYTHIETQKGSGTGQCGWDMVGMDLRDNELNVQPDYDGEYSTTIFTERAQSIVRNHDADQPMFMYLSYTAPHSPLQVPVDYADDYSGTIRNSKRRSYAGMVTYLDEKIGELVQTLKDEGLWDNTVFVFSSDNGGVGLKNLGNNWPLRGMKGNYFEGGIRALGFVNSPLLAEGVRGTSSHELMHVTDWFPTLVEGIAQATTESQGLSLDGVNLWDIIRNGEPGDPEREIVFNIDPDMQKPTADPEYDQYMSIFDVRTHAAIRRGHMKLITGHQENSEYWVPPSESGLNNVLANDPSGKVLWLFNITADPFELNDLSDTLVDEVRDLLDLLADHQATSTPPLAVVGKDCDADPALHGGVWSCWDGADC